MSGTTLEKRLAAIEKEIKSLRQPSVLSGQSTVRFEANQAGIYLKNILANLPENFYWTDREGVVLGCNDNQAKLFGLDSASELFGKSIYDIAEMVGWDKSVPDIIRKNDLEVLKTCKPLKVEETAVLDGKLRTFLSFKNPLMDDSNRVIGIFGATLDITDRKEMEELLRQEKEKAEQINKSKTEFLKDIIKELKMPFGELKKEMKKRNSEYIQQIEKIIQDVDNFAEFDLSQDEQFLLEKADVQSNAFNNMSSHSFKISPEKIKNFCSFYKQFGLCRREAECVYYMVRGMTSKKIAKIINLSYRTVEFYISNAKLKLGCRLKGDLINRVFEEGVI
jgi:PAS domain S-box-containing protein